MEFHAAKVHSLLVQIAEGRLKEEYPYGRVVKECRFLYGEKLYIVDVVGGDDSKSHAYECVVTAYPSLTKLEALKNTFHKVTVLTLPDLIRRAMEIAHVIGEQKSYILDLQGIIAHQDQEKFHLEQKIEELENENHDLKVKLRCCQKSVKKK